MKNQEITTEKIKEFILANWFDGDGNVDSVVGGDEETIIMANAVKALERLIKYDNAIEYVPVRHGEWIAINDPSYSPFDGGDPYKYICSECKNVLPNARTYCSECGSKNDKIRLEYSEAMREIMRK